MMPIEPLAYHYTYLLGQSNVAVLLMCLVIIFCPFLEISFLVLTINRIYVLAINV